MKKLIVLASLFLITSSCFATDYNCQNPNTKYTYSGVQYACGNSTTPNTICYYKAQGQIPPGNNVYGCDTKAPINAGLIFLIIAAVSIGSGRLYKKNALKIA